MVWNKPEPLLPPSVTPRFQPMVRKVPWAWSLREQTSSAQVLNCTMMPALTFCRSPRGWCTPTIECPVSIVPKYEPAYTTPAGGASFRRMKEVSVALVEDLAVGDFVILHVGYAIGKLDEDEARRTLALIAEAVDKLAEGAA